MRAGRASKRERRDWNGTGRGSTSRRASTTASAISLAAPEAAGRPPGRRGRGARLELTPAAGDLDAASLETEVKYEGYVARQRLEVARAQRDEGRRIPEAFRYAGVPGLSNEIVQRLTEIRPETVGQASRVSGVTPAAAAVIVRELRRLDHGRGGVAAQ